MKVLVARPGPGFSVQDVAQGWVDSLRECGCTVVDYHLEERLTFYGTAEIGGQRAFSADDAIRHAVKGIENALYEFWPDVVVVISGFFLQPALYELMRTRGHRIVIVHTESPYEDDRQIDLAGAADVNVVNDPTNLDRFRAVNPNSWYLPQAHDPRRHHPDAPKVACRSDFCFVGTGYPSRIDFFEHVRWDGIDVALAGNWQHVAPESPLRKYIAHDVEACCDNSEAVDLYRATKASANLYRREAQHAGLVAGWAMGPREVELAATGCFYLTEERGENREVLPMVPTFDGPADFEEKLRWHLDRPDIRARIAAAAREAVADRTFLNNACRLLELVGH
jgi:spore maturation protein CgeB